MTDFFSEKKKANDLRKEKKYQEALKIYELLWANNKDANVGAGMLHCLRKLKRFDEAISLSEQILKEFPDNSWCRNEAIWTYIEGRIYKFSRNTSLNEVKGLAQKILQLNPEALALKKTVFSVLKAAKDINDWHTVNEWVTKVNPNTLSLEPIIHRSGRKGWSDQAIWYNYRINALIETNNPKEAIEVTDKIIDKFPKERKFFLRLKALAYYKLGNLKEAEKIYKRLCSNYKTEWWLMHEYAKVVRDSGRKKEALSLMYKAAINSPKLEQSVSLFEDIGWLCKELEKFAEARSHLILSKYVRNNHGWSISEKLNNLIKELNKILGDNNEPDGISEALKFCKSIWQNELGNKDDYSQQRKGLIGKLILGEHSRPFCFINTSNNESYFCLKRDLPKGITGGCLVIFDIIPSYDRKKMRESWRAINVRIKKCQ